MANKKFQKVVKYLEGAIFNSKGKPVLSQTEAWREEAKCGCGIDCCYGALVLTDISTKVASYVYVEDGVLKVTTNPKVTFGS